MRSPLCLHAPQPGPWVGSSGATLSGPARGPSGAAVALAAPSSRLRSKAHRWRERHGCAPWRSVAAADALDPPCPGFRRVLPPHLSSATHTRAMGTIQSFRTTFLSGKAFPARSMRIARDREKRHGIEWSGPGKKRMLARTFRLGAPVECHLLPVLVLLAARTAWTVFMMTSRYLWCSWSD